MALAESPPSPTASGDRSARSAVPYPSFVKNAVIAAGDVSSATSLAVRSRSVGWGTGGLQNVESQEHSWHVLILFRLHRLKQQRGIPAAATAILCAHPDVRP